MCPVIWRPIKLVIYNMYSQVCAIKHTAQYSKLRSTGPHNEREAVYSENLSLPLPISFYRLIIIKNIIYFYIILIQLSEEEGKTSVTSNHDPPAEWLPLRTSFSLNVSHDNLIFLNPPLPLENLYFSCQ